MDIDLEGTLLGESRSMRITVKNGVVTRIATSRDIDHFIIPLLFDIQVNGYEGIDLQSPDVSAEDVAGITAKLAARGVGRWVPTVITGSQTRMERACSVIAEAMRDPDVKRAVPGIHVEGPYISPVDGPRGAHAKRHVRKPSLREFDRLLDASDGAILYTTVAPEVKGAVSFIRGVVKRNVRVALGHTAATSDDIARAVDAGATLSTHLGNGLSSTIHRHENPLWPQLANDRLTASLIPDLHHLSGEILKTFVRAKGQNNIILTSDCVHLAGMKPGHYDLAGVPVELQRSGRICLKNTDLLAGSSLDLMRGVVNAATCAGLSLRDAFACASSVPAKALGVRMPPWKPKAGRRANFAAIALDRSTPIPRVTVEFVFVNGKRIC